MIQHEIIVEFEESIAGEIEELTLTTPSAAGVSGWTKRLTLKIKKRDTVKLDFIELVDDRNKTPTKHYLPVLDNQHSVRLFFKKA